MGAGRSMSGVFANSFPLIRAFTRVLILCCITAYQSTHMRLTFTMPKKTSSTHGEGGFSFVDVNTILREDKAEARPQIRSHAGRWSWRQQRCGMRVLFLTSQTRTKTKNFSASHLEISLTIPALSTSFQRPSSSKKKMFNTNTSNLERNRFALSSTADFGNDQSKYRMHSITSRVFKLKHPRSLSKLSTLLTITSCN